MSSHRGRGPAQAPKALPRHPQPGRVLAKCERTRRTHARKRQRLGIHRHQRRPREPRRRHHRPPHAGQQRVIRQAVPLPTRTPAPAARAALLPATRVERQPTPRIRRHPRVARRRIHRPDAIGERVPRRAGKIRPPHGAAPRHIGKLAVVVQVVGSVQPHPAAAHPGQRRALLVILLLGAVPLVIGLHIHTMRQGRGLFPRPLLPGGPPRRKRRCLRPFGRYLLGRSPLRRVEHQRLLLGYRHLRAGGRGHPRLAFEHRQLRPGMNSLGRISLVNLAGPVGLAGPTRLQAHMACGRKLDRGAPFGQGVAVALGLGKARIRDALAHPHVGQRRPGRRAAQLGEADLRVRGQPQRAVVLKLHLRHPVARAQPRPLHDRNVGEGHLIPSPGVAVQLHRAACLAQAHDPHLRHTLARLHSLT